MTLTPLANTVSTYNTTLTYSVVAPSGCIWSAFSSQPWATITGGASGSGTGVVTIQTVQNSTGATRTATLTVGSQGATITQPDSGCGYSFDQSPYNVPVSGGTVTAVLTTGAGCPWVLTNNYHSAISVNSASSGTGSATLNLTVAANRSTSSRYFYLAVPNNSLTISQPGGVVVSLPVISNSPLPSGTIGLPYSAYLAATGGTAPYAWAVTSGALPPGLSLNSGTGQISGTVNEWINSPYSFTVTVTDAVSGSGAANLSIKVVPYSISSISPNTAAPGSPATVVTLNGANLPPDSKVVWTTPGGVATQLSPSLISAAQVAATVPASLLTTAGTAQMAVSDGTGTLSNQLPFNVTSAASSGNYVMQQAEVIAAPRALLSQSLLFPFVTNQSSFDTEITLSNTTLDTVGSTPAAGTCSLSYYGSGVPNPQTQTSFVIAPGSQLVFNLSKGGGGMPGAPGFQGYIVASCNFRLVRGFAKLSTTGTFNYAQAQEAQVLTFPRSTTTPQVLTFPYVTNQFGFDTGIAITNSSSDPFGTQTSSGSCTLSLFGSGAPSPSSITTPNIPAGTVFTTVISGVAPGFQGYVLASCNFGGAAGFGFVTNTRTALAETAEVSTLPRVGTVKPLLFSGLTNQNGKDTGIAIANTSTDSFGVNGSTPGSGVCTLSLFGPGAPVPNSITTPTIPSGTVYATVLSSFAPGFEGYATANCNFPQARGYSFVSTGATTDGDGLTAEVVITPRSTTSSPLLFPTVTNWTGADTKLSIWNTSADSFGSTPASGTCTISYYGSMLGGGAVPAPQASTTIAAGGQLSFTISQGNAGQGIAATPGFRGYVIAACAFPMARGAATIIGTSPLLQITDTALPGGFSGIPYLVGLGASGGAAPYSNWTIASGALPSGLLLNPVTGAIHGTPTAGTASATPYTFSVTTRDAAGTTSAPVSLSILVQAGSGAGTITGSVQWNSAPVPFSPVELKAVGYYYSLPVLASATTAADGTFSLANVPAGQYTIYALAPGSEYTDGYTNSNVTVTSGQSTNVGALQLTKIFQLLAPADTSTGVTTTPTLQWAAFPGATSYSVVGYDRGTGALAFSQSNVTGTQITILSALTTGTLFQWGVTAYNGTVLIALSPAGHFTTLGTNPNLNPVINGIADVADNSAPPLAPGSLASLFGGNLANSTTANSTVPFPTTLAGTSLTVNNVAAPLNFVSPGQINFQIPYATPTSGTVNVVVTNNGLVSNTFQLAMAPASPGLYTYPAVQNGDGTLNSAQNPAAPNTVAVVYLTGLGAVTPAVSDGNTTSGTAVPVAGFNATLAGQPVALLYLGLTPGVVGFGQANIQIPGGLAAGSYPFVVTIGGRSSGSATIYVGTNTLNISNPASLGTFTTGTYQLGLVATGGDGNYVWNFVSGALPPGLALRTDVGPSNFGSNVKAGLLGVATTPGTYTFTLSVTSAGQTVNRTFTMRITALNVKDTAVSLPDAFVNTPYSYAFSAVGTAGPVTFTANSTAGPITLSSNGALSGTPTTPGNYNIAFQVNDTVDTTFRSFNYTVYAVNLTSPGLLPNATQNVAYNVGLTASGGSGGYTYTLNGGLPSGLTLSSGGAITGTTSNVGRYAFYVKVTDSSGASYTKQLSIVVSGVPAVLPRLTSYGNFDDAVIGNGYSRGIAVINGGTAPFVWSATGLPAGMSIRTGAGTTSNYIAPADAEVWGIPQVAGDYVAQITVTDANGVSTTAPFAFRVSQLDENPTLPNGTVNTAYSSSVRVLGGNGPYTVRLVPQVGAALPAGITLDPNTLLAAGTPVESGGFNTVLEFTDAGGHKLERTNYYNIAGPNSSNISINNFSLGTAAVGSSYSQQFSACCVASYTWSQAGGTLPSGTSLTSGGLLSGTLNTAGTYTFLIKATDASNAQNVAFRQFTLVVSASPLTITTGGLPNATIQVAYTQTLTATGGSGTLTWALNYQNFMPPGLSLAPNGVISGTPTSLGNYFFTVQVTDGTGVTVSRGIGINIYTANGVPLQINNGASLGTWTTGNLQFGLNASGGDGNYVWSYVSGTLPPGVALRTDVGPSNFGSSVKAGLLGVANTPGNYTFTLSVTSAGQTVSRTFTMRITALNVKDVAVSLPDAFVNTAYSYAFSAIGTAGPVTFTATASSGQVTLASDGTLSGTPLTPGTYNVGFTLNDTVDTISRGFNFTVYAVNLTSPGLLPNATQNVAYNTALTASGGSGGYSYAITNGSLPSGLSLSSGGAITGTTSNVGQSWFYVKVTDSNGASYTKNLSIVVTGVPASLPRLYSYGNFDDAVIGNGYSRGISVCCGGTAPFVWSVTGLPAGMSMRTGRGIASNYIEAGDAEVWGVPQVAGDYVAQFTVTDANGVSTTLPFPFRVSLIDENPTFPNGTVNTAYSSSVRPLGGTGPYTARIIPQVGSAIPAGLTFDPNTFQLTGTPLETGGFNTVLEFTDSAGHKLERTNYYNIAGQNSSNISINNSSSLGTAAVGSSYSLQLSACCVSSYTWSQAGGTLPSGTSLTSGGLLSGTLGAAGTYTFLIKAADASNSLNVAYRQFTLVVSATPLTITTGGLPNATLQAAYSQTLTATGGTGTLTWALSYQNYLPPGLSLASNGTVTGTPTSTGNYVFLVQVTDAAGVSVSRYIGINIYAVNGVPLQITTAASLGTQTIGAQQIALGASGSSGTYTWSLTGGTLPPGLLLRTDTPSFFSSSQQAGLIGVATTPGNYSFTLQVSSAGQTVSRTFTITITRVNVMDSAVADAFVGIPYSYTFTSTATSGTVTFNATTSAGPVTLNSQGVLAGTPTTAGSYPITFNLTDGIDTITRTFTLNVFAVDISTPGVLPNGTQGNFYSTNITAGGGAGGYTFSITSGSLPSGLTMSPAGLISGTITGGAGRYPFSLKATDSANVSYTKPFDLLVIGTPVTLPRLVPGQINDLTIGGQFTWGIGINGGGAAPLQYSATGLPPGIIIRQGNKLSSSTSPSAVELWGIPQALGSYPVQLTVTDGTGLTTTSDFTLVVSPMSYTPTLPNGTVNTAYSSSLRVIGGTPPYAAPVYIQPAFSLLPAGLSLSGTTVSGNPGERGTFRPAFRFTDANGATLTSGSNFSIFGVTGTTISINTGVNLGQVGLNSSYSNQLSASGATSYNWALVSGTLPTGVTLSPGGLLSGTVTAAGTYVFRVSAADAANAALIDYRQFTLSVTATPITISTGATLLFASLNSPYSTSLVATGGSGTLTWSEYPFNNLPAGLTLNANGGISGTPTALGQFSFTAAVSDASGDLATRAFTLNVYPAGQCPPVFLANSPSGNFPPGRILTGLTASGGCSSTYHYSLTPGAAVVSGTRVQDGQPLPTNFNSATTTGGYLGVLATPGTYSTSIRVTDSVNNIFDRPITFTVSPVLLSTQSTLPKSIINTPFGYQFTAVGGSGTYNWTISNLPSALSNFSINTTGLLAGTPSAAGTFTLTLGLADAAAPGVVVNYTITVIVNPFAITDSGVLPQGIVNVAYTHTLSAPNCGAGCAWSVTSGSLPSGLTLSAAGVLSGTVTSTSGSNATFTIQASGANGTVTKPFALLFPPTVIQGLSVSTAITTSLPAGSATTTTLTASGGFAPYTWSIQSGNLPPGITLQLGENVNSTTSPGFTYMAGRAQAAGTYTFTIQVTDSTNRTATKTFTWLISNLSVEYTSFPITGNNLIYNTAWTQPILVVGGSGNYTSWSTNPSPVYPGLAMNGTTGVVTGTPTNTGSITDLLTVTDSASNVANTNISFNAASNATTIVSLTSGPNSGVMLALGSANAYNLSPAGGTAPYTISAVGALPAGVTIVTGNQLTTSFTPGTYGLQVLPETPGTLTFTLQATDANGVSGYRTYVVTTTAFSSLSTITLVDGSVSVAYSEKLVAFGGTSVTWSVAPGSALPPGMAVSPDGVLTGVPSAAGTYAFNLVRTDISGSLTYSFTLRISAVAITNPLILPDAIYNSPYTYSMTATGGSGITWTGTNLPGGLSISSAGVISGIPTQTGFFGVTITATDGVLAVSHIYTIVARYPNAAQLTFSQFTAANLGDAVVNQFYSANLTPSGGVAPYTWTVAAGSSLPPGMSLLSGAALPTVTPGLTQLIGQPTTVGQYSFDLILSEGGGTQITRTFNLNVTSLGLITGSPHNAIQGTAYSFQFAPSGGTAPYTFSISPTALRQDMLPAGLTMDSTGLISGTPTSTGSYTFKLTVQDSGGKVLNRNVTLVSTNASGLNITATNPVGLYIGVGPGTSLGLTTAGGNSTYNWSLAAGTLPPGMSIGSNGSSPALIGQPTSPGTYTYTVRATDQANSSNFADRVFTAVVSSMQMVSAPKVSAVALISPWMPPAQVGAPYSFTFKVAGGTPPYTFTESPFLPVPLGLTLSSSGVLSGTPLQAGIYTFTPLVTDAGGTAVSLAGNRNSPSLVITPAGTAPPLIPRNVTGGDASVGAPFLFPLDTLVTGGKPPYTWAVTSGTPPAGLSLLPGGNGVGSYIGGIPTVAAPDTFITLTATDVNGKTLAIPADVAVFPIAVSPRTLPPGKVGTPYSVTLVPSGGTAPYTMVIGKTFDLPVGLTLSPTGLLSGNPTSAGNYVVSITVTDNNGASYSMVSSLTIDNAAGEAPVIGLLPDPISVSYTPGAASPVVPLSITSTSGTLPFTMAAAGASSSLAVNSGTSPASVNLTINGAGLVPGTNFGFVGVNSPGSVTESVAVPVIVTVGSGGQAQTITFTQPADVPLSAGTTTLSATASSGLPVSFTSNTLSTCTVSGSTVTLLSAGVCSVTANQVGNASFAAAPPVGKLFVVIAGNVITFPQPADTALAAGPVTLTATASSNLPVTYTSNSVAVCTVSGSSVALLTTGICSITANQAGNSNYVVATSVTKTFNVTPNTNVITFAQPADTVLAAGPVTLTATATSGLAVSYTSNSTGVCTVSGSSVTLLTVGTCSITANQAGNGTFAAATPVTKTFNVTPNTNVITFPQPPDTALAAGPVSLTATASSGLPVSYSSNSTGVCTVSGSSVTLLTVGTCSITANQAGNGTFTAATPVTKTFNVTPNTNVITVPQPVDTALTAGPLTLTATASSALAVSYTSNSTAVCTVSGSSATLLSVGTCSITANQAGNGTFTAATAVTRTFNILKGTQTISFTQPADTLLSAGTVTLSATATSGLPVTFTSNSTQVCTVSVSGVVTLVAAGSCSITASQVGNANYNTATPVTRTFNVTQTVANPTVTLAVGGGNGFAGDTVEIPITVTSVGTPALSTFQTDLNFDPQKLTFKSARAGAQLTAAGKSLSTSAQPNGDIRFLAVGFNQNVIANGIVAYATFTLGSPFSASVVTPKVCTSADAQGNIIATACTVGTITLPPCDINSDGTVNVADVQLIINEALGVVPAVHDLNHDGAVNVADVQKVINAALGLGCVVQ